MEITDVLKQILSVKGKESIITKTAPAQQTAIQQTQQRSGNNSIAPAVGNVVHFGGVHSALWMNLEY